MKTLFLVGAFLAAMILVSADSPTAQAQGLYVGGGGYTVDFRRPTIRTSFYSPYYGNYGGYYYNDSYYGGGGRYWHDTSHYDYHPGEFVRHRNHYHYVPGHYDYHEDGHWHGW